MTAQQPCRKRRSAISIYSYSFLCCIASNFVNASLWNLPSDQLVVLPSNDQRYSRSRLRIVVNEAGFLQHDNEENDDVKSSKSNHRDLNFFKNPAGVDVDSYVDILDQAMHGGKESRSTVTVPSSFVNSHFPLALHLSTEEPLSDSIAAAAAAAAGRSIWNKDLLSQPTIAGNPSGNNHLDQDPLALFATSSRNSNHHRHHDHDQYSSRFRSTGTTIAGCLVAGGKVVILGADTRATNDRTVADKNCFKIHTLGRNVACCGAGTSADLEALTRDCQYSLALQCLQEDSIGNHYFNYNNHVQSTTTSLIEEPSGIWMRPVSFSRVCRVIRDMLYEARGSLGVNLIIGGVDSFHNYVNDDDDNNNSNSNRRNSRAHLVAIHPHGSMDVVPYAALGSGGLAAMAILEQRYRPDMTMEEGIDLIQQAITAGIRNDLGSGSQVDLCIIRQADEGEEGRSGGANIIMNITRAILPEETLEEYVGYPILRTISLDQVSSSSSGANGFGNLPYQILSRRIVASCQDDEQQRRKWSDLLGL